MAHEFKLTRQVQFCETDMAGIVHFSNYFRYMESVEHAFFRSLGLSISDQKSKDAPGWPRVQADCQFMMPLRFEDEFVIHLLVREVGAKSISYVFNFYKSGEIDVLARGAITVVCVKKDSEGRMKSVPIPDEVRSKISAAPASCFK